jgi:hypothetical protein
MKLKELKDHIEDLIAREGEGVLEMRVLAADSMACNDGNHIELHELSEPEIHRPELIEGPGDPWIDGSTIPALAYNDDGVEEGDQPRVVVL